MIIATQTDGLVRIYRLNGNDELAQVGQLTATQTVDPVLLATMTGDLAQALAWEPASNGKAPAPVQDPESAVANGVVVPVLHATGKVKPKPGVRKPYRAPKKKPAKKPAAVHGPAPTRKPLADYRSKPRASREEVQARRDTIVAHLTAFGPLTATAIGGVVFPGQDKDNAESRARKMIDNMVRDGLLIRNDSGSRTTADTYSAVVTIPPVV